MRLSLLAKNQSQQMQDLLFSTRRGILMAEQHCCYPVVQLWGSIM
jgi:hypothetical protein